DRPAGLQKPVPLRRLDHRQRDAILDRPPGVLALQLEEESARPRVDLLHLDHRRLADQVQQRAGWTGQDGGGGEGHAGLRNVRAEARLPPGREQADWRQGREMAIFLARTGEPDGRLRRRGSEEQVHPPARPGGEGREHHHHPSWQARGGAEGACPSEPRGEPRQTPRAAARTRRLARAATPRADVCGRTRAPDAGRRAGMTLYLDASVLVALMVREDVARAVEDLLESDERPLAASDFALAETSATLARLVRIAVLSAGQLEEAFARLDAWT